MTATSIPVPDPFGWPDWFAEESRAALCLHAPSALVAPDLRFAIDPLVPAGTLTLVVGKDKVGKSLLVMEMSRAVQTGTPFLAQFPTVQGKVIALHLDDPTNLVKRRLVEDLAIGDEGFAVATHQHVDLADPKRFLDALAKEAVTIRPALIIVDALYVLLKRGGQLSHAEPMGLLMRRLDQIAEESGAAVVLVHHTRKSDEAAAGSFVIRASAKSILHLSRPRKRDAERYGNEDAARVVLRVESKFAPETSYALELAGPAGWGLLGEASPVRREDLQASVEGMVSREPGLNSKDLAERLSRRREDVELALAGLAEKGLVHLRETRTGHKGRPPKTWWPGDRGR